MSDSIDQAIEALAQLRELVREAHEASKDLRMAVREAKQVTSGLPDYIDRRITLEVKKGLDGYADSIKKATDDAERAVSVRFDRLGAIFLGEDPESIANGKETLEDMVARLKRRKRVQ
jgi:hypothetical protein